MANEHLDNLVTSGLLKAEPPATAPCFHPGLVPGSRATRSGACPVSLGPGTSPG